MGIGSGLRLSANNLSTKIIKRAVRAHTKYWYCDDRFIGKPDDNWEGAAQPFQCGANQAVKLLIKVIALLAGLFLSSISWAHTIRAPLPEGIGCSGICSWCLEQVHQYVGCPTSGAKKFAIAYTKEPYIGTHGEQCSLDGPCYICPEDHIFSNEFLVGVGQPICRDLQDLDKPPSNCTAGTNPVFIASGNKHQQQTDYPSPSHSGLNFVRAYI